MEPQSTYRKALAQSTRTAHLAGVSCHCPGTEHLQEIGHPVSTPGCTSGVKPGTYGTFSRLSHPSQVDAGQSTLVLGIYAELARTASTPAERKRWREHRRMLDEAHKALRSQPAPCVHCTPMRCSCPEPAQKVA